MAKVNTAAERSLQAQSHTTHEGAPAKRITAELQLRRSVMACLLWEDEHYESGDTIASRIAALAVEQPAETVAALAIEARTEMHLRHVPLWLAFQLAQRTGQGRLVAETLAQIIQRPDELAEFLAIYWKHGKKKHGLGHAGVKQGLALAFRSFSAHQLAKYDRQDTAVKLRDVLFLCHAKPKDEEQAATWKQLVDGTLPTPKTWETMLSAGGDPKTTWTTLITGRQLGGLAFLRNLRNMQEAGVEIDVMRAGLKDLNVERVLPFRFIAAARYAPLLEPELEALMFQAIAGQPKLGGKTILLVDHSGSMAEQLSAKSDMDRFEAAAALAILLREICEDVTVIAFSMPMEDRHRNQYRGMKLAVAGHRPTRYDIGVDRPALAVVPARRGFALRDALEQSVIWNGTATEDAKQLADTHGYDRLIILTDEQSHQKLSNPHAGAKGYVINVASAQNGVGYGKWNHIDGWSEAVVSYIAALEASGPEADALSR